MYDRVVSIGFHNFLAARSELEGAEYDGESEVLEMEKQVEDDRGKEAVEHKDLPSFDGLLCLPIARLPEEEMRVRLH